MPVELLSASEAIPENPRWHELRRAGITASEIAAVLGISPWESPFSLYWRKVNGWASGDSEIMSTGRRLEDTIAEWWESGQDLNRVYITKSGLYANAERPWQIATPDRLVYEFRRPEKSSFISLLECKWVAYSWDGWGEAGTDEIPVYYRAQALWQLDVLGVDEVHFAVLGPGGFRAYLVRRDETDLAVMRKAGEEFHWRVKELVPPDLDGHSATISALRKLHPSVGEGDVEVSVGLAEHYRELREDRKHAEEGIAECEAEIRAALGSEFNRAVCNGKLVASRSVYDQSGDSAELTALEDDWPVVDRLNPGRSQSYA